MVNKTNKTFQEWVAFSKLQLEALQQEPKEKQKEKIIYKDVQSLVAHLSSKEIKNKPKEAIFERLRAYCLNEVNKGNGFTKLQVLKIKSSETFPKAFEKKFLDSFKRWESENLG